jgi:preprotein translocase subunit YajC
MTLFHLALMAPADQGSTGLVVLVLQFAALGAIFYFLLIRPQSQARKKHAELLAGLKKNDEVVTAGGIIGKVKEIRENRITLESGTSTLVVERHRIVQVGGEAAPNQPQ